MLSRGRPASALFSCLLGNRVVSLPSPQNRAKSPSVSELAFKAILYAFGAGEMHFKRPLEKVKRPLLPQSGDVVGCAGGGTIVHRQMCSFEAR